MPGVDGLRALAVAAVLAYHLGASWLPGGFLGVDVFLVVSGFLITSLLLAERRATGRIDLVRFWVRRARRLLPALLLMMAVVLAAMVVLHPGEVARLHGAVLASLAYVANWYFAFADVPYFAQFGRPSVLQHLWSLAVEEQFYLLWPPVLALLAAVVRPSRILLGVAVAAGASMALAWVLWEPSSDPSRIYYGTDTRAVGLLAGVALALAWPVARRAPLPRPAGRVVLEVAGWACLAGVALAMATLGDLDERLYRGGFLLVALATAGVVAVAAHPASVLGRVLGTGVLRALGLRSYGIYLWHWPVIMLTRPEVDVPLDGAPLAALRVALTLGLAEVSYRLVERPVRRAGFRGSWRAVAARLRRLSPPVRIATASCAGALAAALVLAVALLPADRPTVPGLPPIASADARPDLAAARDTPEAVGGRAGATRARGPVLLVGDSVMLGAASELRRAFGRRAVVDAAVARQFGPGAAAVRTGLRRVPRRATVVIHLGNNGFVPFRDLEALMHDLRGRPRVVLVTVRVPLRWQDSVNDALRYAQSRYRNTVIADWHAASDGPGLLVDGAHTTPRGARVYARLLRSAVG